MPILPFEIDGAIIWVETEAASPTRPSGPTTATGYTDARTTTPGGSPADAPVQKLTQVDMAATLKALIRPVRAALDELQPEELTVELALGIKGEVGVFVAKSEANATLKVTAKWKKT